MKYLALILIILTSLHRDSYAESSYNELVADVSGETSLSKTMVESIIEATFKTLTERMSENKGTSIPRFGRFYSQEKYDKNSKNSSLSPRFSYSPDVKKALKEGVE